MLAAYLAAVGALAVLTLLPGPDFAVVLRSSFVSGVGGGVRTALGVVSGLAVWGLLTVAGLTALLTAAPVLYTVIRIAGAAYLVFLGLQLLWRSRPGRPVEPAVVRENDPRGGAFVTGLTTNLLNPKIAVFYTALLPTLVPPGVDPVLWLPVLVATHVALGIAWLSACAALFGGVRSPFTRPVVRRWLERVCGVALVGFGARVALDVGR